MQSLSEQQVGLTMLDRAIAGNPGYRSVPINNFNGFHKVLLENPQKILENVDDADGLKGSVLLKGWETVCPDRAIRAHVAASFLRPLLEAYNSENNEADISGMLMQNITTPVEPSLLTEQGIWNLISPWFRWEEDQGNSNGVLYLKFSPYPLSRSHYGFPDDPRIPPIYPQGTAS